MVGASENHQVHYNPRTVPKPHEELQRLIFPFIEICRNSLNALDTSATRPTAFDLLELLERCRTVLIQDVVQLINIGRTHISFNHAVFKTDLLLKYKETMGYFMQHKFEYSISVTEGCTSITFKSSHQVALWH